MFRRACEFGSRVHLKASVQDGHSRDVSHVTFDFSPPLVTPYFPFAVISGVGPL
jgi:hypothetical protein